MEADIWTFGIFICELFGGIPFDKKDNPHAIEDQIVNCDLKWPRDFDKTAKDLLIQILVLEPNIRLSFKNIKQHRFF